MVIRVEQGKGRQDRYVMLSHRFFTILRTYWKVVRPKDWLFPERDLNGFSVFVPFGQSAVTPAIIAA
jgi:hypothetical protein